MSPAVLRERLGTLPASALHSTQARDQLLTRIRQDFEAAKTQAARHVEQQALSRALKELGDGENIALASARAAKVAFAESVAHIYLYCIFAAFLAMLATLMMPNLPIPGRRKGEEAMPAHVEI